MDYQGFDAYEKSINRKGPCTVFMAKEGGADIIVVQGKNPGFKGEKLPGGKLKAPLNHKNAEILRKLFPFAAPSRVLGQERSFGVGDRLGIATPGHIRVFEKFDAYPVFAQQSIRELTLTNRTFEDVMDVATFAVFREGFKKAWGADGDHLKNAKDVKTALSLGFTMITLDCSEHIDNNVTDENAPALPKNYADKYLGKEFDIGEGVRLSFTEADLKKIVAVYGKAIAFAAEIYSKFFKKGKYKADFEISIDETSTPTTPLQHYFVARELIDAGVSFATLAPRFCGEFQKGVDYIGNLAQFEKEIKIHAVIARHFKYKLSIHSGSDKFTVFPSIGKAAKNRFHVKTAGTNWLEAMRVVALTDPALYREVHKFALGAFEEARKYYHVTTDLKKIPDVDKLSDRELPELFSQNDSRQLIHITYGLILNKKNADGSFTFKDRLYKLWKDRAEDYAQALVKHIGKHLTLLGVKKG
ncbi:MAG: tagaturonate epimerase family protein [Treponema sp.]|nr:tagaturonate epimerase family protein [Treponema sp.]